MLSCIGGVAAIGFVRMDAMSRGTPLFAVVHSARV